MENRKVTIHGITLDGRDLHYSLGYMHNKAGQWGFTLMLMAESLIIEETGKWYSSYNAAIRAKNKLNNKLTEKYGSRIMIPKGCNMVAVG